MAEEIAALLSAHVVITDGLYGPTGWCATCGNLEDGDQENHQSAMLAANGYGNVREARAQALEDAAQAMNEGTDSDGHGINSPESVEQYGWYQRWERIGITKWLRARAERELAPAEPLSD